MSWLNREIAVFKDTKLIWYVKIWDPRVFFFCVNWHAYLFIIVANLITPSPTFFGTRASSAVEAKYSAILSHFYRCWSIYYNDDPFLSYIQILGKKRNYFGHQSQTLYLGSNFYIVSRENSCLKIGNNCNASIWLW